MTTRLDELKSQLLLAEASFYKAQQDFELARLSAQSAADAFQKLVANDRLAKAERDLEEATLQLGWADKTLDDFLHEIKALDAEIKKMEFRFPAHDERLGKIRWELAAAEAARQADEQKLQKLIEERRELAGDAVIGKNPQNPAVAHLKMRLSYR